MHACLSYTTANGRGLLKLRLSENTTYKHDNSTLCSPNIKGLVTYGKSKQQLHVSRRQLWNC